MLGSILAAAGPIMGLLGKGGDAEQKTQSQSGYATLDPEIQDWLMGTIFGDIQGLRKPYQGVPKRALNAEDFDPNFGSPSRVAYLQSLMKSRGATPTAPKNDTSGTDVSREEMIGRILANNTQNNGIARSAGLNQRSSPEDFRALTRLHNYEQATSPGGGGAEMYDLGDLKGKMSSKYLQQFMGA